jgi:hypothetical protein
MHRVQLTLDSTHEIEPRTVLQECATLSADRNAASNVMGAVGPANFVEVAGTHVGIYRKSNCKQLANLSLDGFFADLLGNSETLKNPRIAYDRLHQRFFIAAVSHDSLSTQQFVYFAVSTDNSGASWYVSRTNLCVGPSPDIWTPNGVAAGGFFFLVTGDSQPEFGEAKGVILGIDQGQALAGIEPDVYCENTNLPTKLQPSTMVGPDPGYNLILSIGSRSGDTVRAFKVAMKLVSSCEKNCRYFMSITPFTYSITPWTAPPDAPQPNNQRIDAGDGSFQSPGAQFDKEVWQVHTVNVNGEARWRLYQFGEPTAMGPNVPLFTLTDNAAGAHDSFNPSVAVSDTRAFLNFSKTGDGNVAMMMARGPRSSSNGWATNTIETSPAQYQKNGAKSCNKTGPRACGWSRSSSTQLDPGNTSMAWGFNQLVTGSDQKNWATRAARIK